MTEELEDFLLNFQSFLEKNNFEVCIRKSFNLSALNVIWRSMCGVRFSTSDTEMKKLVSIVAQLSTTSIGTQSVFAFPFLQYLPGASKYPDILEGFKKLRQFFEVIKTFK